MIRPDTYCEISRPLDNFSTCDACHMSKYPKVYYKTQYAEKQNGSFNKKKREDKAKMARMEIFQNSNKQGSTCLRLKRKLIG